MRRLKRKKRKILRRRKSIFTNLYFSLSVFASIIILSAAGFFLFSPRFQIQQLSVSGNQDIPTEELERIAGEKIKTSFSFLGFDFSTSSIFLSSRNGIDNLLEAFPEIDKVSVKKNFPNGISLQIVEKTPFAVWTDVFDNSKCYLVDKNGSFIKNYEEKEEYASLIRISEKEKIDNLDKKDILSSLSKIESEVAKYSISVKGFDIYKAKAVAQTSLSCDIVFYIGNNEDYADLDWQIDKLGNFLNSEYSSGLGNLKYIVLRFGNEIIYCKKGSKCALD